MQKIEFKWVALTAIIVLICGAFYWFEYRPSAARKSCSYFATKAAQENFKQKIQTGEFKGFTLEEELTINSNAELLKKYDGYLNYIDSDKQFQRCLESKGLVGAEK
jgi:hypothetical protein